MRHLAAILFIDIVGYTALMGESEDKALQAVKRLNEISKPLASSYSGKWHKDLGDGTLFSFGSAFEAVKCAIAIQQKINTQESFKVRIGIHMGDITFEDGDVFGDGVNIASRIQGQAAIGGIAISDTVQRNIHNKEGITTIKVGKRRLKNVSGDVELFQIKAPGVESIISKRKSFSPILLLLIGIALGYLLNELVSDQKLSSQIDPIIQRYSIALPAEMPINLIGAAPHGAGQRSFDMSPDGRMLVYVTRTDEGPILALRETNSFEVRLLEGTEGAFYPFFSPDSKWIGFFSGRHLLKISVSGLRPDIVMNTTSPKGGLWMQDNHIIVSDQDGANIKRISTLDQGSTPSILPIDERFMYWPSNLPDPEHILLSSGDGVFSYNISTGRSKLLINEGSTPRYVAPGYIVYAHNGRLKATRYDPEKREITGSPVTLIDGLRTESVRKGSQFAVSKTGDLAYVQGSAVNNGILVFVNRQGEEIDTLPIPPDNFGSYSLSPDGKYLLYNSENNAGLFLYDIERNISSLIQEQNTLNIWSRNGKSFTYVSSTGNQKFIIDRSIDGLTVDTLLTTDKHVGPYSWSYDKRYLIYVEIDENSIRNLKILDVLQPDRIPQSLSSLPVHEMFADFSPNANYFVYESQESSGDGEIFVQLFPSDGQKIKISSGGGSEPFWTDDGKEILYFSNNFSKMMTVPINWTNGFNPGTPKLLWKGAYLDIPGRAYSISPDGSLFLMKKSIESQHTRDKLRVVDNWLHELEMMIQ